MYNYIVLQFYCNLSITVCVKRYQPSTRKRCNINRPAQLHKPLYTSVEIHYRAAKQERTRGTSLVFTVHP